jgi:hypothetical protein
MRLPLPLATLALGLLLASALRAETVEISDEVCAAAIAHAAGGDVAFKPGVDARGNPVAPADLPGQGAIRVPQNLLIELSVPLRKAGQASTGKSGPDASMPVGSIAVDIASGRLVFNGEPLGERDVAGIAEACRGRKARN